VVPFSLETDGAVDNTFRDRQIERDGDRGRYEPCQEPDPQPLSSRKRPARF
jgi:hypothetical protein